MKYLIGRIFAVFGAETFGGKVCKIFFGSFVGILAVLVDLGMLFEYLKKYIVGL